MLDGPAAGPARPCPHDRIRPDRRTHPAVVPREEIRSIAPHLGMSHLVIRIEFT